MIELRVGFIGAWLVLALACGGTTSPEDTASDTGSASDTMASTDTGMTPDSAATNDVPSEDTVDKAALFPALSCDSVEGTCVEIMPGDSEALLEAVNLLEDDTTVVLAKGTWMLANQVTFRDAKGIRFVGQGIDESILSFKDSVVQTNGVDVIGDVFTIEGLTIEDAKKDALRIEDSKGVTIRRVKVTWTNGPAPENGAYGIYPVRCFDVLMEECEAYHAADAGLYIGQCVRAIVRNNIAKANVAGLEIENTQYADVYGNLAEDNTGGILIFDLPGNVVVGRDIKVHNNIIKNNNRDNYAPSGTVRQIPAGTGTFAMASRRVEIYDNTFENNKTGDIAILSGLAIEGKESKWALDPEKLVGNVDDLNLLSDDDGVYNYRTENIVVRNNTHAGSGLKPDTSSVHFRPIGFLLAVLYNGEPSDSVMYGTIGESSFDTKDPAANSNDNHICVGENLNGTFASLNLVVISEMLEKMDFPTVEHIFQPEAPFAPFDCTELKGGPIGEITLEGGDG